MLLPLPLPFSPARAGPGAIALPPLQDLPGRRLAAASRPLRPRAIELGVADAAAVAGVPASLGPGGVLISSSAVARLQYRQKVPAGLRS